MRVRFLLPVLAFATVLQAQTVISVDPSISRNTGKNFGLAIGASAILPGMGQLYLGEKKFVRAYVWSDVAFWTSTIGSYFFGQRQISNAQAYASRYAGVVNPSDNVDFLNTMGDYRSRSGVSGQNSNPDMDEDYDQAQLRAGKTVDNEYPEDASHTWDWGSSDNPATTAHINHYNDILQKYRVSRIVFQISVGALILNRVISILDVMRVYHATSSGDLAGAPKWKVQMYPEFYPDGSGVSMFVGF